MVVNENPYLDARREWTERYGNYIKRAQTWRAVAFLSLGAVCVLTVGLVTLAGQSKVRPFVVEVDKLGAAVAVAPADAAQLPDERIVRFQLAQYLTDARQITSDPVVQKRWLDAVYAISGPAATNFLNKFYKDHDPFEQARNGLVDVEIQSAIPLSKESWQVDWTETKRALTGEMMDVTRWEAIVRVTTFVPSTEREIIRNPSGVVVTQIGWTQKL